MSLRKNKALLILNPKAGKQEGKTHFYTIVSILSQKYDLTVHLTEYAGDATDTAAEGEEFDTIICCGGDGTVGQVLDGVSRLSHPVDIGYIPCGTTNDLATATEIPKKIAQAAQAIVDGTPIAHDVGLFADQRRFVYTATFGAFAKTSYDTPQDMKNVFGPFAYFLSGIGELGSIRNYKVKITYDGGVFEADDVILCAVLNTTSIGGVLKLPRDEVDFADGIFEVLVIRRPADLFKLNALILALTSSNFNNPDMVFLKADSFHIETAEPTSWTVDGENAGEHRSVNIQCLKQAIHFIRIPSVKETKSLPKG